LQSTFCSTTAFGAGALLGMVSSCYVALYGQARILCVVARDHMLPPVLARISPRLGTPAIAATVMGLATGQVPSKCYKDTMVMLSEWTSLSGPCAASLRKHTYLLDLLSACSTLEWGHWLSAASYMYMGRGNMHMSADTCAWY
jgi:hypothetical protein